MSSLPGPDDPLLEPLLCHDSAQHGFVAILWADGERKRQRCCRLSELPGILPSLAGQTDVWISQASFIRPNRRRESLARVGVLFVDLDIYKTGHRERPTDEQIQAALQELDRANIPRPSLIVCSGRGLQLKWLLARPLPKAALPRWDEVQRRLVDSLLALGADRSAKDASRVLRLPGTINSRSGAQVTVPWRNERAGRIVRYDFEDLAREILPVDRQLYVDRRRNWPAAARSARQQARKEHTGLRRCSERDLWRARLGDLKQLARLRGWHNGNPQGHRDVFLFLGAVALSWLVPPAALLQQVIALARELCPTWTPAQAENAASAAISRARSSQEGETVECGERRVDPRYRFKNSTLIEWLQITPDEQGHLATIISADEKRWRDRLRKQRGRRERGAKPRAEYEASARARRHAIRALRAAGHTYREIADKTGVSVRWVKKVVSRSAPSPGRDIPARDRHTSNTPAGLERGRSCTPQVIPVPLLHTAADLSKATPHSYGRTVPPLLRVWWPGRRRPALPAILAGDLAASDVAVAVLRSRGRAPCARAPPA